MARYNILVNSTLDEQTSAILLAAPETLSSGSLLPETGPSPGEEEHLPGNGSGARFFAGRDTFYCICEEHMAELSDDTQLRFRILWHSMDLCNWIETAQTVEQITGAPHIRETLDQKQADALFLDAEPFLELRSLTIWAVRNGVSSDLLPREKKRLRLPDHCAGCPPHKIRYCVPND